MNSLNVNAFGTNRNHILMYHLHTNNTLKANYVYKLLKNSKSGLYNDKHSYIMQLTIPQYE